MKVTNSQLDITNESQGVSPFPADDHRHQLTNRTQKHVTQDRNNMNDPQKKYRLGTVTKNILLKCLNWIHGSNLTLGSDVDQDTKMFGLHERPLTYQGIIS